MKRLIILGAGTAGTATANRLARRLPLDWQVTVVDPGPHHLFRPDLVPVSLALSDERAAWRPREATLVSGVQWIARRAVLIDPDRRRVRLANGDHLDYDLLVIATGVEIRPDETPGLLGRHWRRSIHDCSTLDGARALRAALAGLRAGRLVVNVVEAPIRSPGAPLELLFLAHELLTARGVRDDVELALVTPGEGPFPRPAAAACFDDLLAARGISVETGFATAEVDPDRRRLRSYADRELGYDLLVAFPTHMGAAAIDASGLGDELVLVPTEPGSLLAEGHDHIFALGDAAALPAAKTAAGAHFQARVVAENVLRAVNGRSLVDDFDGHTDEFVETGGGKAVIVESGYAVEPSRGRFPVPWLGPFTLLDESRRNLWAKRAFRRLYWSALLPGRPIPIPGPVWRLGRTPLEATAGGGRLAAL